MVSSGSHKGLVAGFFCLLAGLYPAGQAQSDLAEVPVKPPNFVVILVDDAAFMDFGGFGGEARTPNINQLGDNGLRFANYRTSPLCSPTRAMLLTGLDNHLTGMATIPEVITENQLDAPGYQMRLNPEIDTIAERLQARGYETFMTGKWHLGSDSGDLPPDHGFDHSFALDASGADNWEEKSYMPYYDEAPWYEGRERTHLPDNFYSSDFIVDKMIEYLNARPDQQKPFFSYLAFQAIHIPIQAPKALTDSYDGVYDQGWEALRLARFETAKSMGLIPETAALADMPSSLRSWSDLTEPEKASAIRSMQVNAAMLEAMDLAIGRLIESLKQNGSFENTVFVITSDNGPEFNDPVHQQYMNIWMAMNGYDHKTERLGEKGSLAYIGPEWAAAAASPGNLFKFFTSEGGIRVPLIISGPGVEARGFSQALSFVTDIAPTLIDLAGDTSIAPDAFSGRSLVPALSGSAASVYSEEDGIGMEVSGNAAFFQGGYKLLKMTRPYGDDSWQLYNLKTDPGETRDLSTVEPERKQAMMDAYEAYAARVGVVAPPEGFNVMAQVKANTLAKVRAQYAKHLPLIGGGVLIILIALYFIIRRMFRRNRAPAKR